ncbi:hypothetical protein N657DRAFT_676736 [Parathielavia appendiculata]|uniref:Uncharacterized protein n=1 Tax=Parathielavia appendiculata TaxID=2587402 RepID=A0AAN6Z8N8_9PEZI|nr:hypothetical protein N657DRAFT_676736 [Parathielavia appendiculata]
MHSSRQPAQKGPDGSPMELALQASELLLSMTQIHQNPQSESDQEDLDQQGTLSPPLMHFPHCRLEVADFPLDNAASTTSQGKLEQVALPGPLVRTFLSRFESEQLLVFSEAGGPHSASPPSPSPSPSPSPTTSSSNTSSTAKPSERRVQVQRHFDDGDDWVFSRCLLADFTGFRDDEAEVLSAQGRLCCWASVVLQPQQRPREQQQRQQHEGLGQVQGKWELGFVVHRVGVRDPETGWCECF